MPKAVAIQPLEWATIHPGMGTFDIEELNRVVLDYAHIELTMAKRWSRRTALGRVCFATLRCFTVIGLLAAVTLGFILVAGVDGETLLPLVYVFSGLSCVAVLGLFVPWLLTPYRQWDRTLCGVSVMVVVIAVASIVSVYVRSLEAGPRWLLAAPCYLLLVVAVGAIIGDVRLRATEKPPTVDPATLSAQETAVLLAVRHRALKTLRSRNVVSYADFPGLDDSPLVRTGPNG